MKGCGCASSSLAGACRHEQRGLAGAGKLNLFLHVTGRREDGYHELQTVFQLVDLADTLSFTPRADGEVRRVEGPAEVSAAEDSAFAPRRGCAKPAGSSAGVDIRLEKRIPIQGGLGGGSSDAATTLVALNEIWGLRLPVEKLAAIGLGLGADLPVFVHGQSAWGEGVGERLTPLELPQRHYAIVFPGVGMPTAEVFQAPELTRKTPKTTIRGFLRAGGHNDCEPWWPDAVPKCGGRWLARRKRRCEADRNRQLGVRGVRRSRGCRSGARRPAIGVARLRGPWARPLALQERLAAERSRVSGKV
jgi:4-diphosphocytidyl-2-C-methyl-D-erythritol kinase